MNDFIKLALSEVPQYFMNLMELATHPKTFLSDRCTSDTESTNRATAFAGISLLIAFVIQIPSLPKQGNVANQFAVMVASELVLLLGTIFALRLAWKLVGGTATLGQLFVCTAYVLGPMLFITLTFVVIGDVLFRVIDPDGYALARSNPLAALPESSIEKGGSTVSAIATAIGLGGAVLWLAVAWGAYGTLNGVSTARSVAAFFLYNLIQIPLLILGVLFGLHQLL